MIQNLLLYAVICCSFITLYYIYRGIFLPKPLPIVTGLALVAGLSLVYFSQTMQILIYVVSVASFLLSLRSKKTEIIHDSILLFLVFECITGIWECILSWVLWEGELRDNATFLPKLLSLILFLFVLGIKSFSTYHFVSSRRVYSERSRNTLYYTIILMAIGMMFTISALRHAYSTSVSAGYRIVLIVIIFIAYLSIGGTAILYSHISETNKKMHELLQQEQLSNLMQKQYYTALLETESDTRKFRHDINNHLVTISHMAKSGDNSRIVDYVSSMQGSLSEIRDRIHITGNTLVDILTNYYLSQLPSTEFVNIHGILPETLPIDPYLFNTAYANHLQNAIEAVISMSNIDMPSLSITFSLGEQYFRYVIENSFDPGNKKIYLQKNDSKKDHGFGGTNAENAISQLRGQIKTLTTGNTYTITVVIPHSNTNHIME